MRVTLDTNVVVSCTGWGGPPRRILDLARSGAITICTSTALLIELEEVFTRTKFASPLLQIHHSAKDLIEDYTGLVEIVDPITIPPIISADPDDDKLLACASTAKADYIVSGDRHLLDLKIYQEIPILNAADFLAVYQAASALHDE